MNLYKASRVTRRTLILYQDIYWGSLTSCLGLMSAVTQQCVGEVVGGHFHCGQGYFMVQKQDFFKKGRKKILVLVCVIFVLSHWHQFLSCCCRLSCCSEPLTALPPCGWEENYIHSWGGVSRIICHCSHTCWRNPVQ